jgi:hypothetical protein
MGENGRSVQPGHRREGWKLKRKKVQHSTSNVNAGMPVYEPQRGGRKIAQGNALGLKNQDDRRPEGAMETKR